MSVRIVEAVCELPESIGFGPDVMGLVFATEVAGLPVEVVMPGVEQSGDRWLVMAPVLQSVRADVNWTEYLHDPWAWGSVTAWSTAQPPSIHEAYVKHVLLRVPLSKDQCEADKGKDLANKLATGTTDWWYSLKEWVEVVSRQVLLTRDLPENLRLIDNTRAWSWDGKKGYSLPISFSITLQMNGGVVLDAASWKAILDMAALSVRPPVTHLFLSSARQALHEQRARVAVLDAATAAEIALSTLLDQQLGASPSAVSRLVRKQNRELGRLIEALRALEVDLPKNLKPELAQTRNDAIHGAIEPTMEQARVAYGLATGLVERVNPSSALLLTSPA